MNNALHNLDCPPLMSDGRIATDYRPSCVVHTLINEQNKVANSHQSRGFLQANAVKLMTMNQTFFRINFHVRQPIGYIMSIPIIMIPIGKTINKH